MADRKWKRFAQELKHHRRKAGIPQGKLADIVKMATPTISAYETGRRAPDQVTTEKIDAALSAGGAIIQVWNELTDERDIPDEWKTFEKVEQQAKEIRHYQNVVVPGLLQTPDYARQILRNMRLWNEARVEQLVRQRTSRFDHLDGTTLTFLMDEAVLRRTCGSAEILKGQLDRLRKLIDDGRIWLSVLPDSTALYPAAPSFRLLTLTDGRLVGQEEHYSGIAVVTSPSGVNELVTVFGHLQSEALSAHASVKLIEEIRKGL